MNVNANENARPIEAEAVPFVAGIIFAIGLGISGMTQPAKVLAFLDVTGAWDPSLAFVMIGAIAVHLPFARRAWVARAPRFAPRFFWPEATRVDGRLMSGAAIFGIGWGIAGFCPGPALVAAISLAPPVLVFVAAMLVGMLVYALGPLAKRSEKSGMSSEEVAIVSHHGKRQP